MRGVSATISPSMDIQVSSNFERLLFEAEGRDAAAVRRSMAGLAPVGRLHARRMARWTSLRDDIRLRRARRGGDRRDHRRRVKRDAACSSTRTRAVGVAVAERHLGATPMVTLATAHPAKFPDAVEAACGERPELPDWARPILSREEAYRVLPADLGAIEQAIESAHARRRWRWADMSVEVTAARERRHRRHARHAASGERRARPLGRRRRALGERRSEHGISHLLEHMAFKGTRRRSARDIAEAIEAVGGEMNAETSVDHTTYYVRLLKDDVALGLDVLGDIVCDPLLDPDELAREQHVILQEIGAAQDVPEDWVFELFQEAAFPGQAIGRSILGTPESIRAHTAGDLRRFLDAHYCGPQTVSPPPAISTTTRSCGWPRSISAASRRMRPAPPEPGRY